MLTFARTHDRFPTVIAEGGQFVLTGGTSASAPIFASFVAAINDARLAAGKGPVGFINPAVRAPSLIDFPSARGR